jgi:hypothetical protein
MICLHQKFISPEFKQKSVHQTGFMHLKLWRFSPKPPTWLMQPYHDLQQNSTLKLLILYYQWVLQLPKPVLSRVGISQVSNRV